MITMKNHYHIEQRGTGQLLFALHGFSEDSSTWARLCLPDVRIVAIDLIGHGRSAKPTELAPYELSAILSDLRAIFADISQGEPYSLLGYSMGGRLALHFVLAFPDEPVEKLILESASAGIQAEELRRKRQISDEALAQEIEQKGAEWFADFWGNLPLFDSQKGLSVEVQQEIWTRRAKNQPHALAQTLRATGQGNLPNLTPRLTEISCPILYIHGAMDSKYAQIAQKDFAKVAKIITVAGAGHNTHLEKPEFFNLACAY